MHFSNDSENLSSLRPEDKVGSGRLRWAKWSSLGMAVGRRGLSGLGQDGRMLKGLISHGKKRSVLGRGRKPFTWPVEPWAWLQWGSPCAILLFHMPGGFYV